MTAGHRVGAMIAGASVLTEVEKYIDSVTICANQLGQRAALFGLRNLGDWVAEERLEILRRKDAIEDAFERMDGPRIISCGAYFAFVEHGFDMASNVLAERLVKEQSLLVLPASMFTPPDDPIGTSCLRIAFANADVDGIQEFERRWQAFEA